MCVGWNPCPEEEGEVVVGFVLNSWHGLLARPILKHHMGWQHHPFLVGGPRAAEADVLQSHPCCLQNCPSYPWGPWSSFVTCSPSEELIRLPPIQDLASSSLDLAWPIGRDQSEEEEGELLEVVF